jgi:hypothetical protein
MTTDGGLGVLCRSVSDRRVTSEVSRAEPDRTVSGKRVRGDGRGGRCTCPKYGQREREAASQRSTNGRRATPSGSCLVRKDARQFGIVPSHEHHLGFPPSGKISLTCAAQRRERTH